MRLSRGKGAAGRGRDGETRRRALSWIVQDSGACSTQAHTLNPRFMGLITGIFGCQFTASRPRENLTPLAASTPRHLPGQIALILSPISKRGMKPRPVDRDQGAQIQSDQNTSHESAALQASSRHRRIHRRARVRIERATDRRDRCARCGRRERSPDHHLPRRRTLGAIAGSERPCRKMQLQSVLLLRGRPGGPQFERERHRLCGGRCRSLGACAQPRRPGFQRRSSASPAIAAGG